MHDALVPCSHMQRQVHIIFPVIGDAEALFLDSPDGDAHYTPSITRPIGPPPNFLSDPPPTLPNLPLHSLP